MQQKTVREAAESTGWTPRMLRYVEQLGLVVPARSEGGYRLYSVADCARLTALRTLLDQHQLELNDLAVAQRMRTDVRARTAVDRWLDTAPPLASPTSQSSQSLEALRWDQDKHLRLLPQPAHKSVKETA